MKTTGWFVPRTWYSKVYYLWFRVSIMPISGPVHDKLALSFSFLKNGFQTNNSALYWINRWLIIHCAKETFSQPQTYSYSISLGCRVTKGGETFLFSHPLLTHAFPNPYWISNLEAFQMQQGQETLVFPSSVLPGKGWSVVCHKSRELDSFQEMQKVSISSGLDSLPAR